ncbi:protein kinase C-binding protein NELL1-like isoform X2 [Tetranychus urticae]|uniref:protein kinase C-binding protein NELL1-like isoform X2 n=1 Tax=Tetranychus urticae TaxID=32264 RepID=UPI000D65C7B0|nr:protein kinase C-binding protein NELL1-like isoform X2 [Tetranychus urticae]
MFIILINPFNSIAFFVKLLLLLLLCLPFNSINCIKIVNLQESISELEDYVKNLTAQLRETELRLSKVEDDCQCGLHYQQSESNRNNLNHKISIVNYQLANRVNNSSVNLNLNCLSSNGSAIENGSSWTSNCDTCKCINGSIDCRRVKCPSLNCKSSYYLNDKDCCPVCHKKCLKDGKYIEHGDVYIKDCVKCVCESGSLRCKRINPSTYCPPLNCPVDKQFKKDGECCKYCLDYDFCGQGHDCHPNASCHNLKTEYTCKCKSGFWGNGKDCHDVNECLELGGINGHLCRDNSKCVNTNGSYYCQCLPGFKRRDSLNCIDINECESGGNHKCNENAACINTEGSYYCKCLPGYTGNGTHCNPICNKKCANGGKCIGPDKCSCRRGFYGNYCEKDIDECSLNIHHCPVNSECINKPGWYYCQCLSGYTSLIERNDSNYQLKCIDLDECNEGIDTCDENTICVNTEGSYRCDCPSTISSSSQSQLQSLSSLSSSSSSSSCSQDCVYLGQRRSHNETWESEIDSCSQCSCSSGVTNCSKLECDCSNPNHVNIDCCPKCQTTADCVDQENDKLKYKNGENWLYKCKSCQCSFGEVDCYDIDCPPVQCNNPIKGEDDCCPRCEDDPCEDLSPSSSTASFDRKIFKSKSQSQRKNVTQYKSSSSSSSRSIIIIKPGISINSTISHYNKHNPGCMYLGKSYENGQKIAIKKDPCASCKCKNGRLCCKYYANCINGSSSVFNDHLNQYKDMDSQIINNMENENDELIETQSNGSC